MPASKTAMVVLALSVPMLGACHSLFGKPFAVRSGHKLPAAVAAAEPGAELVAQGRKALDDGQLAAAVTLFRDARQVPEQAAAAANGLAIAYSQLGRADLAERYFREAIAMAPGERRYQANLQRFYRLNPIDLGNAETPQQPGIGQAPAVANAGPAKAIPIGATKAAGQVTVARPASRLVRLSSREVRINGGQAADAAPPAAVRVAAPTAPGAAAAAAEPARISSAYPIRFRLQPREVFVGAATAARPVKPGPQLASAPQYPIRTEFKVSR